MANKDVRFGLKAVDHNGGDYTGPTRLYFAPSGYATDLFIGDPVTLTSTSNTAVVRDHGIGTLPEINITSVGTGSQISAVVVGIEPINQDSAVYGVASTERIMHCVDDPNIWYEIQVDGALASTDIGLNGSLKAAHSGSTVTGMSGYELDSGTTDTLATTAAFQLKIMRAVDRSDNDLTLIHNKVIVLINQHSGANATAGL